jgi:hypothetical protein
MPHGRATGVNMLPAVSMLKLIGYIRLPKARQTKLRITIYNPATHELRGTERIILR